MDDIDVLASGISGPGIDLVTLSADSDPLAQIEAALDRSGQVSAVHIFSHAAAGQFTLSGLVIDQSLVSARAEALARWSENLTDDATYFSTVATWPNLPPAAVGGPTGRAHRCPWPPRATRPEAPCWGGTGSSNTKPRQLPNTVALAIPAYPGLLGETTCDGQEVDNKDEENCLLGTSGVDTLTGGLDDDTLKGLGGNDILKGEEDDDIYLFGDSWGRDEVIEVADEGTDTLDFSQVTSNLTFTITGPKQVVVTDGPVNSVTATNAELLIGGQGTNTLDYTSFSSGITVNLEKGEAEGNFEVLGIENVRAQTMHDTITGDNHDNRIEGGGGNDTQAGGQGDDVYIFGDGWGNETITEEAGQGFDKLDFSSVSRNLTFAVNANGGLTVVTDDNGNQVTAQNIEALTGGDRHQYA